jgi:hypothetical protein
VNKNSKKTLPNWAVLVSTLRAQPDKSFGAVFFKKLLVSSFFQAASHILRKSEEIRHDENPLSRCPA